MKPLTTAIESDSTIELTVISGEQLSAITFVQDYLQLHFDGPVLTLFVWPRVIVDAGIFEQGTPTYRDQICSVIGRRVLRAIAYRGERIQIDFESGSSIVVPLVPRPVSNDTFAAVLATREAREGARWPSQRGGGHAPKKQAGAGAA